MKAVNKMFGLVFFVLIFTLLAGCGNEASSGETSDDAVLNNIESKKY